MAVCTSSPSVPIYQGRYPYPTQPSLNLVPLQRWVRIVHSYQETLKKEIQHRWGLTVQDTLRFLSVATDVPHKKVIVRFFLPVKHPEYAGIHTQFVFNSDRTLVAIYLLPVPYEVQE